LHDKIASVTSVLVITALVT